MSSQLSRMLLSGVSMGRLQAAGPGPWLLGQQLRLASSVTPGATAAQQPPSTSSEVDSSSRDGPSSSSSSSSSPSNSSSHGSDPNAAQGDFHVAYQGFFARPHKRLKYASLLNTFASFAAAPLIVTYSSASPVARVAVTVSVLAFAIITTGGLHWFTSPYVHQLLYNAKTDTARVQTLRFFGGTRWHEFPVSSVEAPTGYHPLASFKAAGKTFYLDKANFEDQSLLARLFPSAADVHEQPQEQQPSADK